MEPPKEREIREELHKNYGHVIGRSRLWNIRIAHLLRRIGENGFVRRMRRRLDRVMAVLKVEDQVLKSYDRMAGVYNRDNAALATDSTVILCKYDNEYQRRPASEIYRDQLAYVAEKVFRPILKDGMTILEIGAGETTTIHNLMGALAPVKARWSALELSWSRIAEGKRWALEHGTFGEFDKIVAASAIDIPFADNSFDVVFTNGCIEQIRYGTDKALSEVLRVARRWVVLYEPTYEFGDDMQKLYMEGAQYCRGLPSILEKLGSKPVRHELAPYSFNPFCPYAVTIVEKTAPVESKPPEFCCPTCKKPLLSIPEGHYCPTFECTVVYPSIWDIPCLRKEDGIFASQLREKRGMKV